MKLAIVTIVDYDNYGNRLQNFALQQILTELGHEAVTIRNDYRLQRSLSDKIRSFMNNRNKIEVLWAKYVALYSDLRYKNKEFNDDRKLKFQIFTNKYIIQTIHVSLTIIGQTLVFPKQEILG